MSAPNASSTAARYGLCPSVVSWTRLASRPARSCMKSKAIAASRGPRRHESISFESASSAVHVQQSPQPLSFFSSLVFFSSGWRIPNRGAKRPERARVRSLGLEQPGPNPCCAFHAGSLRETSCRADLLRLVFSWSCEGQVDADNRLRTKRRHSAIHPHTFIETIGDPSMTLKTLATMLAAATIVALLSGASLITRVTAQGRQAPTFQVDPAWPALPNNWVLGTVTSVTAGKDDHVWIVHRPRTVAEAQRAHAAPPVLEYDAAGKFVKAWGGDGQGYDWPGAEHGIFSDYKGNLWFTGSSPSGGDPAGPVDNMVLKFS